jgi:tetratricopeptide (TPR) repeat protein
MTPPASISLPEKIRVFVSSTIGECAEERKLADKALQSLNHEPFLFEAAGARPYPPRDLYLAKLDQADIFVAIYKNSYGWIADGESISGLEDEYRHAMARGMPCLVYIHAEDGSRDPRLSAIVTEIQTQSRITYSRYSAPANLYERIRDDVESVVAQRFARTEQLEAAIRWDADAEVSAILRNGNKLVPRPAIAQQVLSLLDSDRIVQVKGESGGGKTTLLASIAKDHGIPFVSAVHLSALELVNVLANKLHQSSGSVPQYHLTFPSACAALKNLCASINSLTIIIDGIEDPSVLDDILNFAIEIRSAMRVVYSVKGGETDPGRTQFVVPPLSYDEVAELMRLEGQSATPLDLERVTEASRGNPLLLRYCIEGGKLDCNEGLTNLESARWRALAPRSREIVAYLAIAESRLSLDELMQLVAGVGTSPETISDDVAGARWFLTEDTYGYSIRHEHERTTVLSELQKTPHRYAYYARRTGNILESRGDYVGAFVALERANDPTSLEVAREAVFDASRRGDYKKVVQTITRLLPSARQEGVPEDLVSLLVGLAQAEQQLGHKERSLNVLKEADEVAQSSKQRRLVLLVREMTLWQKATSSLSPESLAETYLLRDEYRDNGDQLAYARVMLEISALMIRLDEYVKAVNESEKALKAFEEIGDQYGLSLARRNLASALSALPGHDAEVAELMKTFASEGTKGQNKRERAWLCNLMVRRFRRAKDFGAAKAYALEAIQIGDDLGDGFVSAINRINMGNVCRDERSLKNALEQYRQASALAQQIGEREIEASATRLAASTYAALESPALAIQHALFAVGLLRNSAAASELTNCLETLGDAYMSARREPDAAAAYREAASSASTLDDPDRMWEMAERALDLLADHKTLGDYLQTIDAVCGTVADEKIERGETAIELLSRRLPFLLNALNERFAIGVLGPYFRLMFRELPPPVAQFMFEHACSRVLGQGNGKTTSWRMLFPLIPLLTAVPENGISLKDTAELGLAIAEKLDDIHYKPRSSGAPHWVFTLGFVEPVICSVSAIDDEVETAVICTLITLFLKGFEGDIQEKIMPGAVALAREVRMSVGSSVSLPESLPEFRSKLVELPCIVTRPTRPMEDPVPTFVFFREGISKDWAPGSGKVSALQILLGETLVEFVFQLFRGEVELEVLRPKMVSLLRRTIS